MTYDECMEVLTENPVFAFKSLPNEERNKIIRHAYKVAIKKGDKEAIYWLEKNYPKIIKKTIKKSKRGKNMSIHSMIEDAISDEREGISFYSKLLKYEGLPEEDKQIIKNIIADEKRHYEVLTDMAQSFDKARNKKEWQEVTERKKEKYEDIPKNKFADPEHHSYPIDTYEHVRAAWSYINMPRNASKYSKEKLKEVKNRIKRAAKKFGIKINDGDDK